MDFDLAECTTKKGSRSLDRRRETSRFAARDRRGKEADIFTDLKDVVPVVEESTITHVDRIALLRVASTLCRLRKNAGPFLNNSLSSERRTRVWDEATISECLDGFVIIADSDGTIIYITESVSIFLGLTQTDLVGRTIKDFIHATDYDDLMRISAEEAAASEECRVSTEDAQMNRFGTRMIMRMKTVISPRGRNLNLKSALYKAIVCRCRSMQFESSRILLIHASTTPAGQGNSICMTNASVKGSETTSGSFMTRHTCDMRFSYVSENFNYLLRHEARSLQGTSFYDLVHPADLDSVSETIRELFRKGHCRSSYYRLIGANNSVAWIQTEATTVNHTTRGQKGQYVLCVHSLLGMQSEYDSWTTAGTVCSDVLAAGRPACHYAKSEIEDVNDYLGRQPQFIDCLDFTPLVDVDAGINLHEYRPMREANTLRTGTATSTTPGSGFERSSTQPRRKDSYGEVFEWLFRDQPNESPPDSAAFHDTFDNEEAPRLGHQQHCLQQQERQPDFFRQHNPRFGSESTTPGSGGPRGGGGTGGRVRHSLTLDAGRDSGMVCVGGVASAPSTTPDPRRSLGSSVPTRSISIDGCRPPMSVVGAHAAQQPARRPRNGSLATVALDDTHRFADRTTPASGLAGAGHAHSAIRDRPDHGHHHTGHHGHHHAHHQRRHDNGTVVSGAAKSSSTASGRFGGFDVACARSGGAPAPQQQQRRGGNASAVPSAFSPLTAGFADFDLTSPTEQVVAAAGNTACGVLDPGPAQALAPFGDIQGGYAGTLPAFPESEYSMPCAGQLGPPGTGQACDSTLQPALSAASRKRHADEAGAINVNQLPVTGAPSHISPEYFEEFKNDNPHLFPGEKAQQEDCFDMSCYMYDENMDRLEYLAPFVPEDDYVTLGSDPLPHSLEFNFPELDLSTYSFDTEFGKGIEKPLNVENNPCISGCSPFMSYNNATMECVTGGSSSSTESNGMGYEPLPAKRARLFDDDATCTPTPNGDLLLPTPPPPRAVQQQQQTMHHYQQINSY